jgi:predicted ferric reductase
VILGTLVLPISKSSVWTQLFGISYNSMLVWHQYMGGLLMIIVACHMFSWWYVYSQQDSFPSDIYSVPTTYHTDNFTIQIGPVMFITMLIAGGILGNYYIRRANYDLFLIAHHAMVIVFFGVLLHAPMSWYFITAGLALWVFDYLLRLYTIQTVDVIVEDFQVIVPNQVFTLGYTVKGSAYNVTNPNTSYTLTHEAGQFVLINVPELDPLAWHPFTIASTPTDDMTRHYIKQQTLRENEWTARLYALAATTSPRDLQIRIEGPYGVGIQFELYSRVMFIAGGIGITPVLAYYRHLFRYADSLFLNLQSVEVVWSVQRESDLQVWTHACSSNTAELSNGRFLTSVYVTRAKNDPVNSSASVERIKDQTPTQDDDQPTGKGTTTSALGFSQIVYGKRPPLKNHIKNMKFGSVNSADPSSYFDNKTPDQEPANKSRMLIFVCGPSNLIQEVVELGQKYEIEVETDVFEF